MADNEEKLEKPLVPPAAKPPTPKAMKKAKPKVPLALLTTREQKAAVRVITELQSELVVWKAAAREQRRAVREQLRGNKAIRNALTALKSNASYILSKGPPAATALPKVRKIKRLKNVLSIFNGKKSSGGGTGTTATGASSSAAPAPLPDSEEPVGGDEISSIVSESDDDSGEGEDGEDESLQSD
ncbi:unnamed protein product [Prorocentrum cordatum]|uniref:Uncharacterized protein n=1 Tax=Prorocentrum cordatum TaxID=2364126 RepID=A0ABN9Q5B9_9DINO|nr:unnamed protein product [Polarella glacialis]